MRHTDTDTAIDINRITLIRAGQLAQALGCSKVTVWRLRHELPPQIHVSRGVKGWLQSDISAWLETRRSAEAR